MDWVRILAYITGTVDQELLLRNEYLAAENRILKAQLKTRLRLTDAERVTLAEIAHRLGRKALEDVANVVKPDTLMGWYRRLVARKFDGSKSRRYPGRPKIDGEIEQLVVRMAKENTDWGYDRIVGAMKNLGYTLSDQMVGSILQRHGIPPVPERKRTTTWTDDDSRKKPFQDQSGRLWDVLYMASHAIRTNPGSGNQLLFQLYRVPRDGHSTETVLVTLKLIIGPGDHGESVITVLLPTED